jgi:hypothetical protein
MCLAYSTGCLRGARMDSATLWASLSCGQSRQAKCSRSDGNNHLKCSLPPAQWVQCAWTCAWNAALGNSRGGAKMDSATLWASLSCRAVGQRGRGFVRIIMLDNTAQAACGGPGWTQSRCGHHCPVGQLGRGVRGVVGMSVLGKVLAIQNRLAGGPAAAAAAALPAPAKANF